MGKNITQKILEYSAKKKDISPGEFIEVSVDFTLANDITAPLIIEKIKSNNLTPKILDKMALVIDHFVPNKDIPSAEQSKLVRDFAKRYDIKYFFENKGIEHALLPEEGLVLPGDVVIGADSHTCTYGALGCFSTGVGSTDLTYTLITGKIWLRVPEFIKITFFGKLNKYVTGKDLILYLIGKIGVEGANFKSLEFSGETIKKLKIHDRFTLCNMVIECGAENGIIEPDEETIKYIEKRKKRKYKIFKSDKDSKYQDIIEIDASKIKPIVAFPHLPSNIKYADEINEKIYIDQVFIGSCTNGWYEDLYRVAKILNGKKINSNVRLIISPATIEIYKKALKNGLIEIFLNSGAIIAPPSCGPCLGGHLGVLAKNEKCLSTTNRNFQGRMGSKDSEVYLSNPYVAASSAINGYISPP